MVDVNFATFATYFDGLLTDDKNAGDIYADGKFLLKEVFPSRQRGWDGCYGYLGNSSRRRDALPRHFSNPVMRP
jgi:hypothetical protein